MGTRTHFISVISLHKKYVDQRYCPLHAQVMFIIDQLKQKYCLFMDNLYMFACKVLEYGKKEKIYGVKRLNDKGIS